MTCWSSHVWRTPCIGKGAIHASRPARSGDGGLVQPRSPGGTAGHHPRAERPSGGPLAGDSSRLHRALLNLFDNALRHSPDGTRVEVGVEISGNWWLLSVRDHGAGLSEEDQRRMFERFYRGDPSRERSQRGGSGLGLAIVQQIAVTHGGRVLGRNHPEGVL
ncbi:sensor histidine kinase [Cyanobium sp. ATX-6F1]|uniref:sensor histidine kinase n=1 Tax=Cyanobium sp. ATX-6F1 TaxID=3137388 RepID=UPI0039BE69EB